MSVDVRKEVAPFSLSNSNLNPSLCHMYSFKRPSASFCASLRTASKRDTNSFCDSNFASMTNNEYLTQSSGSRFGNSSKFSPNNGKSSFAGAAILRAVIVGGVPFDEAEIHITGRCRLKKGLAYLITGLQLPLNRKGLSINNATSSPAAQVPTCSI